MTILTDIPPELAKRAAELATESGRSADEIINQALRSGLDHWEREYRLIQEAVGQADRGEFASDDEIERVRNKYRPEV